MDVECPKCKQMIKVEEWYNDVCPNCGKQYWWDAMYIESQDEEYGILMWND